MYLLLYATVYSSIKRAFIHPFIHFLNLFSKHYIPTECRRLIPGPGGGYNREQAKENLCLYYQGR